MFMCYVCLGASGSSSEGCALFEHVDRAVPKTNTWVNAFGLFYFYSRRCIVQRAQTLDPQIRTSALRRDSVKRP
jgi:hypothetical protein